MRYLDDPTLFPVAAHRLEIVAESAGVITAMNAEEIGMTAVMLGAGRAAKTDAIDPAAGILLHKKTGETVQTGDLLATLFTERAETLSAAKARFVNALTIEQTKAESLPLIIDTIRKA